jgi:hypothetical protein
MALARLSGVAHLRSLEELLQKLEGGALPAASGAPAPPPARPAPAPAGGAPNGKVNLPVYHIPNPDPVARPAAASQEKKSPELAAPSRAPGPGGSGNAPFDAFVRSVLQQKASLGAILEHALPVSSEAQWKADEEIRIGFRKSHAFYQLQAQHKINFDQLEKMLQAQLQRKARLVIETVAGVASPAAPVVSIVEKEKIAAAQAESEKKKKFLEHEIVRDTKEIFGAELSSFDIDKSKT